MKNINKLKPFTRFCASIGAIPTSYLVSMTYEEQLLWFSNFLENTLIPTVNNNAEAVEELQNYVKNYFDNLDVREEIENKLDKMAEDGTLTLLIKNYVDPYILEQNSRIEEVENIARSLASGSPKGVYTNVNDLEEANPDTGVYIVSSNGHIYSWTKNGTNAIDLGVYQASEDSTAVTDLQTGLNETNKTLNEVIFGDLDIIKYATKENKWSRAFSSATLIPEWQTSSSYVNYTIAIQPFGQLRIGRPTHFQNYEKCYLLKEDGSMPSNQYSFTMKTDVETGKQFCVDNVTFYDDYVEINMNKAYQEGVRYLTFVYYINNGQNANVQSLKIYNALDPNWLVNSENDIPEIVVSQDTTAIVGREWNLYFSNIIPYLDSNMYVNIITDGLTKSDMHLYDDELRYTPSQVENGTITISINNKLTSDVITSKTINMTVLEPTIENDKYVVCIGDSLTDSDIWTGEIEKNLSNGKIHSVGTIRNNINNPAVSSEAFVNYNEGRAGWSSTDYAGSSSASHPIKQIFSNKNNAFYNNGVFDFGYYMNNVELFTGNDTPVQSGIVPNAVVIGLGTNGSNYLNYALEGIDRIITSIEEYNANIPIILSIITMPATQNGVGNNNNIQNADELRIRHFNVNKAYIEKYDHNPEHPNVHIAEVNYNLDCLHDFDTITQRVSARNPLEVERQNNNVHPSVYGYLKFADVYFANLKRYMR